MIRRRAQQVLLRKLNLLLPLALRKFPEHWLQAPGAQSVMVRKVKARGNSPASPAAMSLNSSGK